MWTLPTPRTSLTAGGSLRAQFFPLMRRDSRAHRGRTVQSARICVAFGRKPPLDVSPLPFVFIFFDIMSVLYNLRMRSGLLLFIFTQVILVASLTQTEIHTPDYLTSPGYPGAYPPSQQCVWVISAPEPGQKILINFNPHFDLEDRDCKYDFVEVYNGGDELSPMLGKFCGKIAPSPIISSGSQLLIKFVSDYETHGAGFSVRYEVFKTGPECSRNFTAPRGVIKTPGFPEKYPNNLDCTFMIFAPQMSEIVVEFDSFDMEPDTRRRRARSADTTGWRSGTASLQTENRQRHGRRREEEGGDMASLQVGRAWIERWRRRRATGEIDKTRRRYGMKKRKEQEGMFGPHIGRYCGPTSPGRVISYTGILSMTITTDNAIAREGFSANYTIRERILPPGHEDEDFACMEPLGMESGEITSEQISASSQYNSNWSPERSRLNYEENGWTPSDDTVREWVQVDLGFLRFVTAIGTQGAISKETKKHYYVRSYKVDLSSNGEDWVTVKEGSKQKISDAQISASSYADRGWVAENARLLTGRSGWTGQQTKQPFRNEWLQVDLGQDKMVSGVVIQGGKHRDRNVFMKRFRIFLGNQNQDTPELRSTGSLLTRFIRIYPERATSEGLGLRLELLGCELDATTTAPPTAPGTTAEPDCEDGLCGAETEDPEDYDTVTAGGATAVEPILDFIPAYVWFACNFDFSSFCGWTRETGTGAEWLIQTNGAPTLGDRDTPSKTGEHDDDEEEKVASLASLPITATDSDLCMSFWYHMFGEHAGALHVVVEGVAERRSTGHIAVDNIQIIDGLSMEDCKDPETPTSPPTEIFILPIDSLSQDNSELGGPGNMLKTLDPILITIIAMSALGVFLGAICGVVLYCACSQGSMTDRNLSALENYNFELVDGVKLKKDKMNGQNNYSEAFCLCSENREDFISMETALRLWRDASWEGMFFVQETCVQPSERPPTASFIKLGGCGGLK
ncbi:hypothetical protein F7725_011069 [Dissostichus mawsoni]|uniref:Neuropilin n=1 Tax=Dissostichus mawsoni TaxID=36200 RepID=A0A7J5ZC01_DISMA|nr:hypothetical protein F7725_011069 [Dissostichus mawsoni]